MLTRISSKGQVVLPKALRNAHRWTAGTRLVVEDRKDGVLLRPAPVGANTRLEEVVGCLGYRGPAKTIAEMDAAVRAEARKHAR